MEHIRKYEKGTIGWYIELAEKVKYPYVEELKKTLIIGPFIKWAQEKNILHGWTEINRKIRDKTAKNSQCDDYNEYQRSHYKKYQREYRAEQRHKNGISMELNEDCSYYFGVYIGERLFEKWLLTIFNDVKKMYANNPRFDFICKDPKYESIKKYHQFKLYDKEYKIQLKLRTLKYKNNRIYWDFNIRYNDADYFILCGFDNRNDLNILHIWLINKDEIIGDRKFWRRDTFCITNRYKYLLEFKKYELKDELVIKDELATLKYELIKLKN